MKPTTPFFSIIIPTYNSGETLEVSLKSIVNQTYSSVEIIIMDCLSTDATITIAKKYQQTHPNINIVSEKDRGVYDAMNKAIAIANGTWLFFMGSDDYFYSLDVLEKVSKVKEIDSCDVIYGNVISSRFAGEYAGEFTYFKLAKQNFCHQAVFFNKMVFTKIGKFNLKYKILADWEHNIRWFYSTKIKNKYLHEVIAYYSDGGLSSVNEDVYFKKHKNKILFYNGLKNLSLYEFSQLIMQIAYRSKKDSNWLDYILFKTLSIGIEIIIKIKNIGFTSK